MIQVLILSIAVLAFVYSGVSAAAEQQLPTQPAQPTAPKVPVSTTPSSGSTSTDAQLPSGDKAPIAPSALSQSLRGRLALYSLVQYNTVDLGEGDWEAGFGGGVGLRYLFAQDMFAGWSGWGTLTYSAIDFTLLAEKQSYSGVLEAYQGAFEMAKHLSGVELRFGLGAVYGFVSLNSEDPLPLETSREENKAGVLVSGASHFQLAERLSIGPRLDLSFGDLQATALSTQFDFIF